jgi:light-regulated signal transduction histidine kinase (bacteriophytochrome)
MISTNEQEIVEIILKKYEDWRTYANTLIETKQKSPRFNFTSILKNQKYRMDDLRHVFADLNSRQMTERDGHIHRSIVLTTAFTASVILVTFIFGCLMAFLAKHQLQMLSKNYHSALGMMKRSNEELEEMVKARTQLLSVANQELESFSYSVSHDLRAPLRAISGFSQALREDATHLSKECQDHIDRVVQASKKMGLLIDSLLNFSRLVRADLVKTEVNLSMMAEDVIRDLRTSTPDRSVECIVEPNLIAFGDQRLLHSAVQNLLENAWKFSGQSPCAQIKFGALEKDGIRTFYVRDNGVGFDMVYVSKLFGAFQRLHSEASFSGTGIGLATVSRIVRRHGGTVWAEGEVGVGATFYFTLGNI